MVKNALDGIKNYLQVSPEIFTGGQPTPDQIKLLGENGFTIMINLAESTSPDALPDEQELCRSAGMAYVYIPVNWSAPTKQDLLKFFLMYEQHRGFMTFVHCALNMRVSVFIFLYRVIVEKLDKLQCWEDVLKIWQPNDIWQKYIDQMLLEIHPPENVNEWQFDWH